MNLLSFPPLTFTTTCPVFESTLMLNFPHCCKWSQFLRGERLSLFHSLLHPWGWRGSGAGNLSHSCSVVGQWFASIWVMPLFRSSALHGWWYDCVGSLLLTSQSAKLPIHKPRQRKIDPSILSDIAPKLEPVSHDWGLWGRTKPLPLFCNHVDLKLSNEKLWIGREMLVCFPSQRDHLQLGPGGGGEGWRLCSYLSLSKVEFPSHWDRNGGYRY